MAAYSNTSFNFFSLVVVVVVASCGSYLHSHFFLSVSYSSHFKLKFIIQSVNVFTALMFSLLHLNDPYFMHCIHFLQ